MRQWSYSNSRRDCSEVSRAGASRRHWRETDDATDGNDLLWVVLERRDDAIDLGRRRPAVPLVPLADEPRPTKRYARVIYRLGTNGGPVDGGSMHKDCLDVTQVDCDSDGTCPFFRPLLRESDDPFAIEFHGAQFAQSTAKAREARLFGHADHLAYLGEILAVNIDQASERLYG